MRGLEGGGMRTLILATAALWAGCSGSSELTVQPDMAVVGDLATLPDSMVTLCSLSKQDCPTGQKCVEVNVGNMQNPIFSAQCVALAANPVGVNQTCMRMNGMDNCDKGLLCSTVTAPAGMRICLPICIQQSDCTNAGDQCVVAGAAGVCAKPCTVYGSDCPSGMTCGSFQTAIASTMTNIILVPTCRSIGMVALGGACMRSSQCPANAACGPSSGKCATLCDSSHPCPASTTDGGINCQPLVNSTDIGTCE
jgi:hypothetical protein